MTAKEFLRQYRTLSVRVDVKLAQIEELRCVSTRLSPTAMFDKSGKISDRVGRTVAKIVDLEREILSDIDELVEVGEEIRKAINSIDDERLRTLLELRYINGFSWEKIARILGYDVRHVTRLHGAALKEIKDVLECPY